MTIACRKNQRRTRREFHLVSAVTSSSKSPITDSFTSSGRVRRSKKSAILGGDGVFIILFGPQAPSPPTSCATLRDFTSLVRPDSTIDGVSLVTIARLWQAVRALTVVSAAG